MKPAGARSALRVQQALGASFAVLEFDTPTRTAQEAAAAVGCAPAQIAKSLVFRGRDSGDGILAIASGANRVDEKKLGALAGEPVVRPDADFVRRVTGFAIGGVPPVAHASPLRVFLDADLQRYPELWAAGGTPNAIFRLTPAQLAELTGGEFVALAKPAD